MKANSKWDSAIRCATLLIAVAAPLPITALSAQSAETKPCDGLVVSTINVRTQRPDFRGAHAWWRKFARSVGLHHSTTSEGLVRRFVSLSPGRLCTEFRRSESERILRAQPFLADATVSVVQRGDSALIDVTTIDEVPVLGGARLEGVGVRALSFGTLNFRGAGMHLEGRWEQGRAQPDGFGGKLAHYQMFGRPWALIVEGMRHPIGENLAVGMSHPFYTDLQKVAWHAGYATGREFMTLQRSDDVELVQPVDRSFWDIGGVVRFGRPRKLWLLGGMLMSTRAIPLNELDIVNSEGKLIPIDTTGMQTFAPYKATQTAGVLGIRMVKFERVRGLDVLATEQDVAKGVQVAGMLGIRPFASKPFSQSFVAADAYFGAQSKRHFFATRVDAESRLDVDQSDWNHLVVSGRSAWYYQPRERWVTEFGLEGAAVWRSILPWQIELGDRVGGVRGYARAHEPGGRRMIARLEQRLSLGRYQQTRAAYGVAAFADAGQMWQGDTPFGLNTPIRASAGLAMLAAVPARSQRTMRGELAIPFTRAQGAGVEFRFVVREPIRGFWFEPPRVRWARLSAVPEQIFNWP